MKPGPTVRFSVEPTGADAAGRVGDGVGGGGGRRARGRRRGRRAAGADLERAGHLPRVRVADERVVPVPQRHRERALADLLDPRREVDAGAAEMEVVLVAAIVDRDVDLPRGQPRHRLPLRVDERDREARPDDAGQLRVRRAGDRGDREPGREDQSESDPLPHHTLSTRAGADRISTHPRGSAPWRSARSATIRSRASAASASVSVRSGAWNVRWRATDFRPGPTWSPR